MNIILYFNKSPKNKVAKDLGEIDTLQGNFRGGVDILNPVINIKLDELVNFNYIYIPDMQRYYFVNDITSVSNGIYSINCVVDVLHTYKNEIMAQSAIVERQAVNNNYYITDPKYTVQTGRTVVTKNFPSGFDNAVGSVLLTVS